MCVCSEFISTQSNPTLKKLIIYRSIYPFKAESRQLPYLLPSFHSSRRYYGGYWKKNVSNSLTQLRTLWTTVRNGMGWGMRPQVLLWQKCYVCNKSLSHWKNTEVNNWPKYTEQFWGTLTHKQDFYIILPSQDSRTVKKGRIRVLGRQEQSSIFYTW